MHSQPVLAVFAKKPIAGQVKTRLATATSPEFAAALAEAMLIDTLNKGRKLECDRVIVFAPSDASEYFQGKAEDAYRLMAQDAGGLGKRLESFLAGAVTGDRRVVVIGSDSPTLPSSFISDAWDALANCDVVLGPATDGGYYLVGCTGRTPPIFEGIEWSGLRVLDQTLERVVAAGLRLRLLPPWYDVDTSEDLAMLRGHLRAMDVAGEPIEARHVWRFLQSARLGRPRET